jgi:hypothetical protein
MCMQGSGQGKGGLPCALPPQPLWGARGAHWRQLCRSPAQAPDSPRNTGCAGGALVHAHCLEVSEAGKLPIRSRERRARVVFKNGNVPKAGKGFSPLPSLVSLQGPGSGHKSGAREGVREPFAKNRSSFLRQKLAALAGAAMHTRHSTPFRSVGPRACAPRFTSMIPPSQGMTPHAMKLGLSAAMGTLPLPAMLASLATAVRNAPVSPVAAAAAAARGPGWAECGAAAYTLARARTTGDKLLSCHDHTCADHRVVVGGSRFPNRRARTWDKG